MTVYQSIVPIPSVVIVDKEIEVDWKLFMFDSNAQFNIYANSLDIRNKFNQLSIT